MAGMNQVMIDNANGMIMHRASLHTADDTAVMECLQKFTPDEAEQFANALMAAATTIRSTQNALDNKSKAEEKKTAKRKVTRRKAKSSRRANRGK